MVERAGLGGHPRASSPELARAVLSVPVIVVRVSGSARLCGLCGRALSVEWLVWLETILAASMTGKIAIGKKARTDGGLFLLNNRGP